MPMKKSLFLLALAGLAATPLYVFAQHHMPIHTPGELRGPPPGTPPIYGQPFVPAVPQPLEVPTEPQTAVHTPPSQEKMCEVEERYACERERSVTCARTVARRCEFAPK